jgi:thiol-disulfide isomerase/thioredoxin
VAPAWCGNCRQYKPTLTRFADKYPAITVALVDFDAFPLLAGAHKVTAVPTAFVYVGGARKRKKLEGKVTLSELEAFVQSVI